MSGFRKAARHYRKVRIAIDGPAGAGKTYTSLAIATGLTKGTNGQIAVIDSEHGRSEAYAGLYAFDICPLADKTIRGYLDAMGEAARGGYEVVVIDSLTHVWHSTLAFNEQVAKDRFRGNTQAAWSVTTPLWKEFLDSILAQPYHVIATMRSRTRWMEDRDNNGKAKLTKQGAEPDMRGGIEFEFDLFGSVDLYSHTLDFTKNITLGVVKDSYLTPGPELGEAVALWLADAEPEREPTRAERIKADPTCVVQVLREEYPEATDGMTDDEIKDRVRGQGYRTLTQIQDGASRLLTSFGTFIPNGDEATTQDIQETFDAVREETPA